MKKYIRTSLIILLLSAPFSFSQESEKPFVVSPLIGDTLSLEERDYYNLIPTIDDFNWAVFYLNPDSTLNAKISRMKNSVSEITQVKHYKSLSSMRSSLHLIEHTDLENEMTCYLKNDQQMKMKLISLNDNSMLIYDLNCDYNSSDNECVGQIKYSEIKMITKESKSDNILLGAGLGLLAGAAIGALIGNITEPSSSSDWINSNMISTGMGAVIGAGIGLVGGIVIGIATSTPDLEIESFSEEEIKGLSFYSRYPYSEPDELKKIK